MKKRYVLGFTLPCTVEVYAESAQQAVARVHEMSADGEFHNIKHGAPWNISIVEQQSDEDARKAQAKADDEKRRMDKGFAMQKEMNLWAIWSIYEKIDVMDTEVPFPDKTVLEYIVDDYWGRSCAMDIMPNTTWRGLWRAADVLMRKSGDTHHQFIESFELMDDGCIRVHTGS